MAARHLERRRDTRRPARRGGALLAVLALLALATALVMGTFAASRAVVRAALTTKAAARADAGARRALAGVITGWEGEANERPLDSIPPGTSVGWLIAGADADTPPLLVDARVRRLGAGVFLVVVDARVTAGEKVVARRRYRMLVDRPPAADGRAHAGTPSLVPGWALDETN